MSTQLRHIRGDELGGVGLDDVRAALVGGTMGWACLFVACWYSPLPRMLSKKKEEGASSAGTVEVCDRVVAMLHAAVSSWFGIYAWTTPLGSCVLPGEQDGLLRTGVGLTAAFIMYDLGMLLASDVVMRLRPISTPMLIHHANILLFFFVGLAMHSLTWFMASMLVNEVSTVPLHITWFLKEHGKRDSILFSVSGACLVLSFLVARVIAIPSVFIIFLRAEGCRSSFKAVNVASAMFWLTVFVTGVHWALNVFWFYKLLLLAGKKRSRDPRGSEGDPLLPDAATRAGLGPPAMSEEENSAEENSASD